MREPFGKEQGKTKRENHSNTSSTLQHRHNSQTNSQFIPEKKSGGGGIDEVGRVRGVILCLRERKEEKAVERVFDQDGGSLQTWGPLASQDGQKPPK